MIVALYSFEAWVTAHSFIRDVHAQNQDKQQNQKNVKS